MTDFGFDPAKLGDLVAVIRLRLALLPAVNGDRGMPGLTVLADSRAVAIALCERLTVEEVARLRFRYRDEEVRRGQPRERGEPMG